MSIRDWAVWRLDVITLWVYFWVAQFAAIEFFASGASPIESWRGQMVTDHLRPVIHSAPVVWWVMAGVWLWLGFHFLWPGMEQRIAALVGGG